MPKGIPNKKPIRKRRKKRSTVTRSSRTSNVTLSHGELGTVIGQAIREVLNAK